MNQTQTMLMALTLALIIVVALMSPDMAVAFVIIGGLLGFYAAYTSAGASPGGPAGAPPNPPATREPFAPLPGAPAPYAIAVGPSRAPEGAGAERYPGAIDVDEYDTEAAYGHRDLSAGDNDLAQPGNPYNRGRISYPTAAAPCADDEANDVEMDGDELAAIQGRVRNDAERVIAGTMNRRRDFDKYFREEVEEAEGRVWWGRHEH